MLWNGPEITIRRVTIEVARLRLSQPETPVRDCDSAFEQFFPKNPSLTPRVVISGPYKNRMLVRDCS
jgi:hypothetical protein